MSKKILIVDDSLTERHVLQELVKTAGFIPLTASSGDEGVKIAKEALPDLILMDVVMPGLNGYQATRELSKNPETKHIPVIMCTSRGGDTDKLWGMKQGAQDYVVKPINKPMLLEKIKAMLKA